MDYLLLDMKDMFMNHTNGSKKPTQEWNCLSWHAMHG